MGRVSVEIYTFGYHVKVHTTHQLNVMRQFANMFNVWDKKWDYKAKRYVNYISKSYFIFLPARKIYSFHISSLQLFFEHMAKHGVPKCDMTIARNVGYAYESTNLVQNPDMAPYESQLKVVEFLSSSANLKVLPLTTGGGKTLSTLFSIPNLDIRTVIILSAYQLSVWLKEITALYLNGEEELLVIQGKKALVRAIENAKLNELNYSLIIITLDTLATFINEPVKLGYCTYGCDPIELYPLLKVGLVVSDEAHTELGFRYKHAITCNFANAIYLSATLVSHREKDNELYEAIYPHSARMQGLVANKYINVFAISYVHEHPNLVRCLNSKGMYNHAEYEKWIMASDRRKANYFALIYNVLHRGYLLQYTDGQVALIFMALKEMCFQFANYLKERITNLTITDYTGDHDEKILYEHDIVISTPGSCGTAKDIPNLTKCVCTVAVDKREKNEQMIGRLRPIDKCYPNITPTYLYLVASDIPTHITYHERRMMTYSLRANNIKCINSGLHV